MFFRLRHDNPVPAMAGWLVEKKAAPVARPHSYQRDTFCDPARSGVLIVGALTFFASWALAPIVEHLAMLGGKLY